MVKLVVIPALAALLACMPGKILFGQKIILSTESGHGYVIDMATSPCKAEPVAAGLKNPIGDGKLRSKPIALLRRTLFHINSVDGIRYLTTPTGPSLNGISSDTHFLPGDSTQTLTVDKDSILYWVNVSNQLVWSRGNVYKPGTGILGTVPFKANGDMVFYKDKLYLTAEEGVVEVNIKDPASSKLIIPTPGRVFPGLVNVPVGCSGNKVYGVEAVGNTTRLVEFDLEQNRILNEYCSFNLGSPVSDAASPTETGESPYLRIFGESYYFPDCLPDTTVGSLFQIQAFTPAGDSGLTYTFTKGEIVKGPYRPAGFFMLDRDLDAGLWKLQIKSSNGCVLDTLLSLWARIPMQATIATTSPDSCGKNTGEISVKMIAGEAPFQWAVEGGQMRRTPIFDSLPAGDHKLIIKDRFSCSVRYEFTVVPYTISPIKNIAVVPAQICGTGGEIKLDLDPSLNFSNTTVLIDSLNVGVRGQYKGMSAGRRLVQVKVGYACVFDTVITVPVLPGSPPVISLSTKHADCTGKGSITVQASNISSPFDVSFNGGSFLPAVHFDNLLPGIYPVVVKDLKGCEWHASATILPYIPVAPPVIDSVVNENRCLGVGHIRLAITGAEAPYRFQVDGGMYNSGTRSVDLAAGTYPTVIYNASRCAVDTVQFTIREKGDCDTIRAIYVPSAFTPNGDGKNDLLVPIVNPLGKVTHFIFRVYNRSGQVLFESRTPGKGWDGKYKGTQQPTGVYVWMFQGTEPDGKQVNFKGTTLLLR